MSEFEVKKTTENFGEIKGVEIPSDSEEEEEELSFAERVARKVQGRDISTSVSSFTTKPGVSPSPSSVSLGVPLTQPVVVPADSSSSVTASKLNKFNKDEKENGKRKRAEEKNQKKQQKETEKINSKALKEAEKRVAKQTELSEVSKYLTVVIDPETVNCPPGNDILSALQNPLNGKEECKFVYNIVSQPVPQSISWRRKIVTFSMVLGEVRYHEEWREEGRALIVLSALDLVQKIETGSLEGWARASKEKLGGKHVTLMIYGYEYLKEEKAAQERVRTAKIRGELPKKKDLDRLAHTITKYDFDESVVSLSLERVADHLFFEKSPTKGVGWKDLGSAVFHQTRAVAEAPLKLSKELAGAGGFSFLAKAGGKNCVDVKNTAEYWKQMLMAISSQATLEKVTAIVSQYPTPQALLAAYQMCDTTKQAQNLLANMEVRRADNILGGKRKIGPDLSWKIHTMMTSHSPDTSLNQRLQ